MGLEQPPEIARLIYEMRGDDDDAPTFRQIGREFGINKYEANELYHRWKRWLDYEPSVVLERGSYQVPQFTRSGWLWADVVNAGDLGTIPSRSICDPGSCSYYALCEFYGTDLNSFVACELPLSIEILDNPDTDIPVLPHDLLEQLR